MTRMKNLASVMILLLSMHSAIAQSARYAVSNIPIGLLKKAHAVMRDEKLEFTVRAIDKATLKIHEVLTVLDESAKSKLVFNQFTDKFNTLGEVRIQVYDSAGLILNSYERKDLHVEGNWQELVPNGKYHYLVIPVLYYPVTIETEYEINFQGLFSYPSYYMQESESSVEKSEYLLKVPKDIVVRYRPMNTDIQPQITEDEKKYNTYLWKVTALKARPYDDGGGPIQNSFPWIMIAPSKFELDGYPGDMTSWKDFGLWYNNLVKQDNTLSPEFQNEIVAIAARGRDEREKINIIYSYLQKNFRYVSIQLGIGGLKPFSADFVHKKKYGDCKALSNYVQACLSAVNIKSYSAWVRAGSDEHVNIAADFPYDPFNHQILCVPLDKDSIWLECTSSVNDAGSLGSFTDDREALLLTENGGVLVHTPRSKANDHLFHCNSNVNLNEDGSGTVSIELQSSGDFKTDLLYYVSNEIKDKQKEYFVNKLDFIHPDDFTFEVDKNDRLAKTKIGITVEKIPDFTTGKKMFLHPRIHKLWAYALPATTNRLQDFFFKHPFLKTDSTVYHLPEGYKVETLPKAKSLTFEYGSYTTSYIYDESRKTITTTARLLLTDYKIPVKNYTATKLFFDDVLAEFTEKIVVKKE